ncbi:MAG: diaminopimelate decarboxylase [Phenylobacterium sp. RIFCSPHIGHO2_01_FULL_69_31]|uniref:diaminopimelate decarboxylase n=1 Tax=Phenylobacterium sp. RIFCSPHIGHO2_01_FULL_69_31 TaxID=1801944 RepID=UPI0008B8F7FF|nr:diaminopimelate decarboxylase [Phenylobacterium sp. RIFCSPHIGHO2_01_FULL_69_31]OHB31597.1 MAG: diaminopimelate decarboxylase [Phenylobacterium sp. RIFCSPHIGHO2_01_FULL_69_31]
MSAAPTASVASEFWWARDDLAYREGRLYLAGRDLAALAATAPGPLHVYSEARVQANLARLQAALAQTDLPTRVYYAMKANRFEPLLQSLARAGRCGVDVCSPAEMERALACGFAAADISFTGTAVSNRDLDRLLAQPALTINCDSVGQIRRIGERAPGRAIGIRVNPERGTGYAGAEKLTYAGEAATKFGIYRQQWPEALAMAKAHGLSITSLHFHVGCGYLTRELDAWDAAVGAGLAFLDDLPDVRTVNVGGGLGLPHRAGDAPLDLSRWAAVLARRFAGRGLTVAVEPGDYLVKDAGVLLLRVVEVERKRDVTFVSVDGGFNLAPEPAYYGLPCEPVACAPRSFDAGQWRPVTVAGNINEALDIWAADHPMPELREGDCIALINAGGYGASMSSNHCMRGDFTEMLLPA